MLHSTCRNILWDFGSIFLNDVVCSPKLHGRANHSRTKKELCSKILVIYQLILESSSRSIHGIYKLIIKCEIIMWVSWSRCVVVCWSPSMKLIPKINWLKHWVKSTETRLFVRSTAFCKLIKTGPFWAESSGDCRDPPTKGQWWQLSMKWRHDQCKDVIENSNDFIDTIWLTLLHTNRLSLSPTPTPLKKEKNRCGVSWYSTGR